MSLIRFNSKTGRWSDELPPRLCNWLASSGMVGGAVALPPAVVTRVDSAVSATAASITTVGLGSGLTGPGIIVFGVGANSGGPTSCTFSNSGSALSWNSTVTLTTNKVIFMAYAIITGSVPSGTTFTATGVGGSFNSGMISIDWLQGVVTASPVDQSGSVNNAAAATLTATLNNANADDIIIACVRANTITWTAPVTSLGNVSNNYSSGYQISNTTGNWSSTATWSSTSCGMGAISFKRG